MTKTAAQLLWASSPQVLATPQAICHRKTLATWGRQATAQRSTARRSAARRSAAQHSALTRPLLSALLSALLSRPSRNSALFLGHRPWPIVLPSFLAWLVRPTPPASRRAWARKGSSKRQQVVCAEVRHSDGSVGSRPGAAKGTARQVAQLWPSTAPAQQSCRRELQLLLLRPCLQPAPARPLRHPAAATLHAAVRTVACCTGSTPSSTLCGCKDGPAACAGTAVFSVRCCSHSTAPRLARCLRPGARHGPPQGPLHALAGIAAAPSHKQTRKASRQL